MCFAFELCAIANGPNGNRDKGRKRRADITFTADHLKSAAFQNGPTLILGYQLPKVVADSSDINATSFSRPPLTY